MLEQVEVRGEGEEGGGEGREAEQGRSAEKMHCKARGQPCLMAIIQKGWKEAALPVKSSSCNLSSLPREKSPMKPAICSWGELIRKNTVSRNVTEKYCLRTRVVFQGCNFLKLKKVPEN